MINFIVNPGARVGGKGNAWTLIRSVLEEEKAEYTVSFTKHDGHARELATDITSDGKPHTIAVAGGDGTLNEVIGGICDLSKVTIGYIPTGSSNDFARGMGMKQDIETYTRQILHPRSLRFVDVGIASHEEGERRFMISSGIGFDAAVCYEADASSPIKKVLNKLHLGRLTYTAIALKQIIRSPRYDAEVVLDGKKMQFSKVLFIAAMNLPYEGGGFKFCPKASHYSNNMEFIIAHGIPLPVVLILLPTAFFGQHVRFKKYIRILSGNKCSITADRRLPVHTDGEAAFSKRSVTFTLEPEPVRFIMS